MRSKKARFLLYIYCYEKLVLNNRKSSELIPPFNYEGLCVTRNVPYSSGVLAHLCCVVYLNSTYRASSLN